ncbi:MULTISPECIES: hypothetical protein [Streptomyces]|uniref:hypothetical protein n=1 Tax=Streptomyces TaxID=1883 RepID=UPI001E37074C|nr:MULTISPECIES: hypothetical protein [Streptomyces]UFQ18713.1 hypothetical protein J2N69_29135 [Streptomyces huasconensis]WCL88330.1 hypothetical protein PPN52_29100 [Streptomyces sp. JCM 35825]
MARQLDAAHQLKVIDGAPRLSRPAGVGERVLGVFSVGLLPAGLAAVSANSIQTAVRVLALVAALALMTGWYWFHLGATRRRPHTATENAAVVFATMMLGAPGSKILWDNPAPLGGSLIAAALPTVGLLVYLVLRWRR